MNQELVDNATGGCTPATAQAGEAGVWPEAGLEEGEEWGQDCDRQGERSDFEEAQQDPWPCPHPCCPPAQGSTTTGSELQRGGSLKDKLKKKFSRRTRGEIFVHVDLSSSLPLHRSTYLHYNHYRRQCRLV